MIGTSDQSCWLAEACKILLLLPASRNMVPPGVSSKGASHDAAQAQCKLQLL